VSGDIDRHEDVSHAHRSRDISDMPKVEIRRVLDLEVEVVAEYQREQDE
jgi:hypothetical protein